MSDCAWVKKARTGEDSDMTRGRAAAASTRWRRGAMALYCRLQVAALLGAVAFCLPAFAESTGDNRAFTGDSRAYKLAPGDRITVTVFGQPEVSGDLLVDGAGNVVMPFIGSIEVKNLTVAECQKLILDRLAAGIFNQPSVSVRINELRPIYVLGDVRTPGSYAFRYGITVKSAVALAGGFGVAEQAQSVSEYLLADERVRQLTFQKQSLLIRQARVEAQRDGKDTFSPPGPPNAADDKDIADLVAIEKETMASQATLLKSQLDLLRSQQPRLESEIEALNSQMDKQNKQIDLVKQQVDQYSRLVKQGLGLQNAEFQFKLNEAGYESNLWRLAAEVSRLQRDRGDLSLKIQEAEANSRKQIMAELLDVRQRLKELEITLPSARDIRAVRLQLAGSITGVEATRSISITRRKDDGSTVIQATDTTPLEPGDIVEIKKVFPRETPRLDASAEQSSLAR